MRSFKDYLEESIKDLHHYLGKGSSRMQEIEDASKDVHPNSKLWHDKAFGKEDRLEFDLPKEIPEAVKHHVESNGGKLDQSGHTVTLKSGREVPTSKFLGKSNAPKDVNNEYQHHLRNSSASGDSKLVISKHPGEVSSGSTGTYWSSCADLRGDGPAADSIPHEIKHGTMIAMHVNKNAKPDASGEYAAKDVLGRRFIKKYHTDNGHVVYHQEGKSYGQFPDSAIKKTQEFLDANNHKKYTLSTKNENVYDDDNKPTKINTALSKEDITNNFAKLNDIGRQTLAQEESIPKETIDKAIKDKEPSVRKAVARNKNISEKHVEDLMKDPDVSVRGEAIRNPNINKKVLSDILNKEVLSGGDIDDQHNALRNPAVSTKDLEKISKDKDLAHFAVKHPNAPQVILTKALKDKDSRLAGYAARNHNISDENLHLALEHPDTDIRIDAADNPNMKPEHFSKLAKDENLDSIVGEAAVRNPKISREELYKFTQHPDDDIASEAKYVYRRRFRANQN